MKLVDVPTCMNRGVCEVNHEIIVDTLQRLFVYVKLIDIYSIV